MKKYWACFLVDLACVAVLCVSCSPTKSVYYMYDSTFLPIRSRAGVYKHNQSCGSIYHVEILAASNDSCNSSFLSR